MAWNAHGTRLPARMQAEYLRGMFLDNALAHGEWRVGGKQVNLSDIRVPSLLTPDERLGSTTVVQGSWWTPWLRWLRWLRQHSTPVGGPPPSLGAPEAGLPPLEAVPGSYVLQR